MSDSDLPEPDRVHPAPHPRHTEFLVGQEQAEAEFLSAYASARLHHGWMLCGPRGVGKATLAWRIARFLLTRGDGERGADMFGDAPAAPDTLDTDPDDPVVRRATALSEPRLALVRRGPSDDGKRLMDTIGVREIRRLGGFFGMSAADGGRRVVIVDAADDMTVSAANALLKILEEPPAGAVLLLVCHQPARLLPTIRSRCRMLRLGLLSPDALTRALAGTGIGPIEGAASLAELAGGSAGMAVRLESAGGAALYADLLGLLSGAPSMDRARAIAFAEQFGQRGAGPRIEVADYLIDSLLGRLARNGAGHPPGAEAAPDEARTLARLAPGIAAGRDWAALQADISARLAHGRAVNLDPASLILDTVIKINDMAGRHVVRA